MDFGGFSHCTAGIDGKPAAELGGIEKLSWRCGSWNFDLTWRKTMENHCGQDLLDWKNIQSVESVGCLENWCWRKIAVPTAVPWRRLTLFRNQRDHPLFQCQSCQVTDWSWRFLLQGCFGINVASNTCGSLMVDCCIPMPSTWAPESFRRQAMSLHKKMDDNGATVICHLSAAHV